MNPSENLLIWKYLPVTNNPLFSPVCSMALMKTLWERKKLLRINNFSIAFNVFFQFLLVPQRPIIWLNQFFSCRLQTALNMQDPKVSSYEQSP